MMNKLLLFPKSDDMAGFRSTKQIASLHRSLFSYEDRVNLINWVEFEINAFFSIKRIRIVVILTYENTQE